MHRLPSLLGQAPRRLAVTFGTCAVTGTASTMALIAETLDTMLPDPSAIPAVHADGLRVAEETATLAARMAIDGGPLPSSLITRESVENALCVMLAVSGSTNAIVHLAAIAGRAGIDIDLEAFNRLSDDTPVVVDLKPVGTGYMEDFHAAGGLEAVLRERPDKLHLGCRDITGQEACRATGKAACRPVDRAVVFSLLEDLAAHIDDPDPDVQADDMLVLQNAGPRSRYGMPEAGYLPIPKKRAARGVKDMVRISDARISGTAFGTIVLHITPEADLDGPPALVQNGDRIRLSASEKRIDLLVGETDLARRPATFVAPMAEPPHGYAKLYRRHVLPATLGCDFDFLRLLPLEDN